jgi:transposase-like protein
LLHKWKKQYEEDPQYVFPGKGRLKEPDEEMRRLRKELAVTKEERDILKKVLAILYRFKGKWAADITYIPIAKGFCYLMAIIDWNSRMVLS